MIEALWVTFSSKQHVLIITVRDMDWKLTQGINISTILKKAWRSWIERIARGSANNTFLFWLYSVLWLFWYEGSVYWVVGSLKILTGIFCASDTQWKSLVFKYYINKDCWIIMLHYNLHCQFCHSAPWAAMSSGAGESHFFKDQLLL